MLLQKEKQSIEEIGKKDKKIYERRKVSLSNIYDLLFPQKSRKYFRTNAKEHIGEVSSVKVSFCTSFRGKIKKGSLAVETALVLPLFFLGMVTLISFMDIYKLQTEHLTALCTKAKQAGSFFAKMKYSLTNSKFQRAFGRYFRRKNHFSTNHTWQWGLGQLLLKKGQKRSTNFYSQCLPYVSIDSEKLLW